VREVGHEPSSGHLPIAHDGLRGNLQHFCRLLHAEASEKSELDDLGFAWVDLSQRIQRLVDGDISRSLEPVKNLEERAIAGSPRCDE